MSEEHLSHHLREMAEQEVPGTVDLWQAIRAGIEVDQIRQPRRSWADRVASCITVFQGRTAALAALSLMVLLVTFGLAAVPSAQGRIDGILHRFGLMLVDSTTITPADSGWIGQTYEQALANGDPVPLATIGEALRRAPFPVHLPRELPAEMKMTNVTIRTAPPSEPANPLFTVVMTYSRNDGELTIQESQGRSDGFGVPESQVQDAQVNGRSALYAQGVWQQVENAENSLEWDSSADRKLLSWDTGGVTYVLDAYGLDLSREDMLRIAKSLS